MTASLQRTSVDRAPTRIVVVDDDQGVRGALDRLLRATGFEVRTYPSAEEFLSTNPPDEMDCLVLDVYLGGMNGIDLYAKLCSRGHAPPTVFMTAHDDAKVTAVRLRSEAVICLRKPFEDRSLLAAIDAVGEMGR